MTKKRLVGIPDEIFKNLEEITSQIINKINKVSQQNAKKFFCKSQKITLLFLKMKLFLLKLTHIIFKMKPKSLMKN